MAEKVTTLEAQMQQVATKADLAELRTEMNEKFALTKADLAELRAEMNEKFVTKADLAKFHSELRAEMNEKFASKADFAELRTEMDRRFSSVEAAIARLDGKFTMMIWGFAITMPMTIGMMGAILVALIQR